MAEMSRDYKRERTIKNKTISTALSKLVESNAAADMAFREQLAESIAQAIIELKKSYEDEIGDILGSK